MTFPSEILWTTSESLHLNIWVIDGMKKLNVSFSVSVWFLLFFQHNKNIHIGSIKYGILRKKYFEQKEIKKGIDTSVLSIIHTEATRPTITGKPQALREENIVEKSSDKSQPK